MENIHCGLTNLCPLIIFSSDRLLLQNTLEKWCATCAQTTFFAHAEISLDCTKTTQRLPEQVQTYVGHLQTKKLIAQLKKCKNGKSFFLPTTRTLPTNNICRRSYLYALILHAVFISRVATIEEKNDFPSTT